MIIKSIRHHSLGNAQRSVNYILRQAGGLKLFYHIDGFDHTAAQRAFNAQEKLLSPRKNRVYRYHDVLSFHPDDAPHLTYAAMRDLTLAYIERRCPHCVVLAAEHTDKDHRHIHLLYSANCAGTSKALQQRRRDFFALRRDMEAYQMQHYPQLKKSLAYYPERRPIERIKLPKQTPTTALEQQVQQLWAKATDYADFLRLCRESYPVYMYRGKAVGILYHQKKYRWKRLGIETEQLTVARRLEELRQQKQIPHQNRSRI